MPRLGSLTLDLAPASAEVLFLDDPETAYVAWHGSCRRASTAYV